MFLRYKSISSQCCIFFIISFCVIIHFLLSLTLSFLFIQLWIKSYPYILKCFLLFLEFSSFLFFYVPRCFLILFLETFSFSFFLLSLHFRHSKFLFPSEGKKAEFSRWRNAVSFSNVEIFLSPNSITVERNLASHSLRRGKDRKSDRMFTRHWSGIDDVHASTLNRKEIPRNVYGSLDSRQEVTLEEVTTSDWPTE